MSHESNKEVSDYDTVSLTESMDGSPTQKVKKKKKLGLFHYKSKKTERKVDRVALVNGKSDSDVQLVLHETQVTTTTATSASIEEENMPLEPAKDVERTKQSVVSNENENTSSMLFDTANNNTLDVHPVKKETSSNKKFQATPPTHKLRIVLFSGENLASRDTNGLSDPYVKFKVDGKTMRKSKCCKMTLNPRWNEEFELLVHEHCDVTAHVFDWDRGLRDDFMGMCRIDLSRIDVTGSDVTIELQDRSSDEELGFLHLNLSLAPLRPSNGPSSGGVTETDSLAAPEKVSQPSIRHRASPRRESDFNSLRRKPGSNPVSRNQVPIATATVQLVSGTDLPARDANGLSDPYVKLLMGKQKRKSKVCYKTLNPVWKEEYTFQLVSKETSTLDVTVWDRDVYRRDDFLGRCDLDLWSLERDETHSLSLNLVDTSGSLLFLVTVNKIAPDQNNPTSFDLSEQRQKYAYSSTFRDLSDVGFAEIRIVSASNLKSADINGKSDPFCVVQLCNARAQTQTCYKTLDPVWNRTCNFPVRDIHDVFEILLFDQDKDSEKEFLGRVSIPILRARNGEQCSYVLKDRKLKDRTKGTVTIQINYIFNPVRGAIRTFSPREEKFMEEPVKFKKNLLLQNFQRVWRIVQSIITTAEFVNSCFTWENPRRSAFAFVTFLILAWNCELYMFPIFLLLLFLKNYIDIYVRCTRPPRHESIDDTRAEDDDQDEESSNKLSLMQKLNALQDVLTKVQNILDGIASFGERIYNTFTWSVPFLSGLAVVVLSVVSLVLYFIPVRVIVLLWGINKFTKRLRKPNYVPNNEIMDFLSRIPSNVQLDEYRELKSSTESPRGSKKKK
uniref:Multiple C2 and transmembrane domain-containing protein 1-like n=1 Tax=Phallusia mammillata TaxID=59560 RepID=A0A6F9DLB6_9ASCI|nr:multiple C2 and transmembrane domain-containing protein 1-like [Phallusia mammillata]